MEIIKAEHINESNIREYGQLIRMPNNKGVQPTVSAESFIYYGKLAVMNCTMPLQYGLYHAKKTHSVVTQLEQHQQTQELLFAVSGHFVVPAALSKIQYNIEAPDRTTITAFMINQGEGILFEKGIWHCSPIPINRMCTVLVVFKEDTHVNDVNHYELDAEYAIKLAF